MNRYDKKTHTKKKNINGGASKRQIDGFKNNLSLPFFNLYGATATHRNTGGEGEGDTGRMFVTSGTLLTPPRL